jgi:uncharacterized RDD family membrane protein YckC
MTTLPAESPVTTASTGARVVAAVFDIVGTVFVTLIVAFTLVSAAASDDFYESGFQVPLEFASVAAIFVVPVVCVVFNVVTTVRWGYTIGKRIVGLRVVDASTGTNAPARRICARTLVLVAPFVLATATTVVVSVFVSPADAFVDTRLIILLAPALFCAPLLIMMLRPGVRPLQDRAGDTSVVRLPRRNEAMASTI